MKQNIKFLESRVESFSAEVTHQINLLNTCKTNIWKDLQVGNQPAVQQQKMKSTRAVRRLQEVLASLENLRYQVEDKDLKRMDNLILSSRRPILEALKQFEDFMRKLPSESENMNDTTLESEFREDLDRQLQIQLELEEEMEEQQRQAELASSLEKVQEDVQTVNHLFCKIAEIVQDQKEVVDRLEDNVEKTHANIINAEKQLAQAAKLKMGMYPLTGALIGTILGGPVGLIAGLKIGTVAALTGSIIGFTGGKVLKDKQLEEQQKLVRRIPETTTICPRNV